MGGAVLNTINTCLDPNNIATILKHSEAKVFFVDYEYIHPQRRRLRGAYLNTLSLILAYGKCPPPLST
ncbi:butyrate--CoA ligase AAE11, peroxisomal-like [Senna tora]|uniref:Butyrate--CoA ligase AAE11, peroxisomal-like n=1 Tax=Senna tora TaxID=362788 RepID=A0A834T4S5_9FABA|nr:butyrate--CoA ligase AAE11, peroxisomal-like [Senna tora]